LLSGIGHRELPRSPETPSPVPGSGRYVCRDVKSKTIIALCLIGLIAGFAAIWKLREDRGTPMDQEQVTDSAPFTPERAQALLDAPEEVRDADSVEPARPAVENTAAISPDLREQRMADWINGTLGRRIAEMLSNAGLAPSDSEEIVRTYSASMARCIETTFANEAARQSLTIDEFYLRMQAAMDFGDINPSDVSMTDVAARVAEVADVTSMEANLLPCLIVAVQQAGLSLESLLDAVQGQPGFPVP